MGTDFHSRGRRRRSALRQHSPALISVHVLPPTPTMPRKNSSTAATAEAKPPMSDLTQVTSSGTDSSTSSVNINDFEFCATHGREVCADCGIDSLEDNDFVAGIDHVEGREPIAVDFTTNKNGEIAFKKQIVKLSKDAQKSAKKNKQPTSNLYG